MTNGPGSPFPIPLCAAKAARWRGCSAPSTRPRPRAAATEALGKELGVSRVGYGEIDDAGEYVTVGRNWTLGEEPDIPSRYRLDAFDDAIMAEVRAGRPLVIDAVGADAR